MKNPSKNSVLPIIFASLLCISGCDQSSQSDNESTGRLVGGIPGAAFGKEASDGDSFGTVLGAVVGSYIGGQIGKDIDKTNRQKMAVVLEKEPSNKTTKWIDPDTGVVYEMKPAAVYTKKQRICRPFTLRLHDPQKKDGDYVLKGTACRTDDGAWEIGK